MSKKLIEQLIYEVLEFMTEEIAKEWR